MATSSTEPGCWRWAGNLSRELVEVPGERRMSQSSSTRVRGPDTGVRPHRCAPHPDRRVLRRAASKPAATGAGGDRARGRHGPGQRSRYNTFGDSVDGFLWPSPPCSVCRLGPVNGCSAPRFRSCCCFGKPRGRASSNWPGPRHAYFAVRASSGERTDSGLLVVVVNQRLYFNADSSERLLRLLSAPGSSAADRLFPRRGSEN